jgi:hypothetical protein
MEAVAGAEAGAAFRMAGFAIAIPPDAARAESNRFNRRSILDLGFKLRLRARANGWERYSGAKKSGNQETHNFPHLVKSHGKHRTAGCYEQTMTASNLERVFAPKG